jgi:hypothetical protein
VSESPNGCLIVPSRAHGTLRTVHPSRLAAVILVAGIALVATAGAAALVTPGKTLTQPGQVTPLALTGRKVAFGMGVSPAECRVRLWSISKGTVVTLGQASAPSCTVETSTGTGIFSVSVASDRVVWLAYGGGNVREWSLFTATPRSAKPLRLRFAARNVDGPAPIVLGPGTAAGIPYAVNREIVYLGEDGVRLFKVIAAGPVRLIAAGPGPFGIRVVALTAEGRIVPLAADGTAAGDDIVVDGVVKALRLFAGGVAYQVGNIVNVVGPGETGVTLPGGATMVDVAAGRILYQRAGDLGAVTISTGADVLLVDGTPAQPVAGQLDTAGLVWARAKAVSWRFGPLPAS